MKLDPKSALAAMARPSVIRPAGGGLVVGEAAGGPRFKPLTEREILDIAADLTGNEKLRLASVDVSTPSQSKDRHWTARAERRKGQRGAAARAMKAWLEAHAPRLVITVTRVSQRRLDEPNLGEALKAVIDGFSDAMRLDDGSPIVKWRLEQLQAPEESVQWSMRWQRPRVRKATGRLMARAKR